jgi:hypothetical protein
VPVTEVITVPSERTATSTSGTVIFTSSFTTHTTVTGPPTTTTSAPAQVSTGAAASNHPVAYAVAGAMALLALA